jgi:hypothetical protein
MTFDGIGRVRNNAAPLPYFSSFAVHLAFMCGQKMRIEISELLHCGIPHRARRRRVDVELPVQLLRRQNHHALRKGRDRQQRADPDR